MLIVMILNENEITKHTYDSLMLRRDKASLCLHGLNDKYTPQKSLATLDGEIVDPEIAVKFEMRDVPKVHGAQTLHSHHLIYQM